MLFTVKVKMVLPPAVTVGFVGERETVGIAWVQPATP